LLGDSNNYIIHTGACQYAKDGSIYTAESKGTLQSMYLYGTSPTTPGCLIS